MGMDVMALPISCVSSCCSRSCSLCSEMRVRIFQSSEIPRVKERVVWKKVAKNAHCQIHILHGHLAVDLFHGCPGILHGHECFLVDVCGFDRIDLLFEHGDLTVGLLKRVLMLLLPLESVTCHWNIAGQQRSLSYSIYPCL